ncbi:MAG TPA: MFS transporter [Gaiellaceae bacterium]|nr:MFS transporter [Gaiellaceae bacterium]
MIASPLRRNRDFVLLQTGLLLSSAGSQMTAIAYPLLVLALTGSPAKAGVVAFVRFLAMAALALPSGIAADRWNRRRLMIAAHATRACVIGTLGLLVLSEEVEFWMLPLVAFVEGGGAAVFSAAQSGAFRAVVPTQQLPAAVAVVTGRDAAVQVASPALGGVLFGLARALPFLVHAVLYVLSAAALLAMRTPFQEEREADRSPLRSRVSEGFRFIWDHAFLRTTALLFGLANFIGPGVLLAIVVIGEEQGLTSGRVGLLVSVFGAGILVGAFLSPVVRRRLPVRGVLLLELWTWTGCSVFLVWPNVYVLTASIVPTALAIPSTDSVVHSYRYALTPDRLQGRVTSVWATIGLAIAPLGPLVAGLLLDSFSARATIAAFAAIGLLLALWGTLSPAIRTAPSLDELAELPAPAG